MHNPFIIYHATCDDGFCAAWLCKQAFPKTHFHAAQYGTGPPNIAVGRAVLVVDFSYPRDVMIEMNERSGGKLFVLDHHKTAREDCEGLPFCSFDMTKCGARMTFEFLKSQGYLEPTFKKPQLLDYIEDRDLWKWELPMSRRISAVVRSHPREFDVWDALMIQPLQELAMEGTAIQRYRQQVIDHHINYAKETKIAGYSVLCANCTAVDVISEVAGTLAEDRPFGATYFDDTENGERVFSLRSRENGMDVSAIAKSQGGGGHKAAAGFKVPLNECFSLDDDCCLVAN